MHDEAEGCGDEEDVMDDDERWSVVSEECKANALLIELGQVF